MILDRKIAPEVHDFGHLTLSPVTHHLLPNGIRLHLISGGDNEVSRLTIALPGGEYESPIPGMSQCATSLLVEGTTSMTGEEIANTLEYNGAWINSSVSTHYSSVSLFCLNECFDSLLPIILDMILRPTFPEDATSRLLRRTIAKIEVEREKVTFHADEALRKMVYGADHPFAKTEDINKIKAFTPAMLASYHFSRLDPKETHIFLSGKLSDKMIDSVKETFASMPTDVRFPLASVKFPTEYHPATAHIKRPEALQAAIKMMIPAIGRNHPDFVALRCAVTALGGYFGSRLMTNIREDKGLTYGISASLLGYTDESFISISTQADNSYIPVVIREIKSEIEKMKYINSYTEDEITRLRRFITSNLAATLDTPFTQMDFFQTHIYVGTPPDYFETQQDVAGKLSAEMLAQMAQKYFNLNQLCTAIAGNEAAL